LWYIIVIKRGDWRIRMQERSRQDIMAAGEIGAKYDEAAKAIWRNREIIAPLLKYSVEELKDESVESIMKLIDADSIEDGAAVSDLPPTLTNFNTEDSSITEKLITYDFRFVVKNPKLSTENLLVVLHIDLEFNNKYRPVLKDGRSYPLIKRGIYYGAREVSSQLGRITEKTNYDDIEKVISIWVVSEDIPAYLRNTASRYHITKEDFIGTTDEPKADYDLIEVVIIRRGDDKKITEPLFHYLESVYQADLQEIDKYTPASANPELKKEVEDMPGMSQVIYDRGWNAGTIEGEVKGRMEGQNELVEAVQMLRSGKSREDLVVAGMDEQTINLALVLK